MIEFWLREPSDGVEQRRARVHHHGDELRDGRQEAQSAIQAWFAALRPKCREPARQMSDDSLP